MKNMEVLRGCPAGDACWPPQVLDINLGWTFWWCSENPGSELLREQMKARANLDYIFTKKEVRSSTGRNEVWVLRRNVKIKGKEDRALSWDNERLLNGVAGLDGNSDVSL